MCLLWECAQAPPKSQSHAMWSSMTGNYMPLKKRGKAWLETVKCLFFLLRFFLAPPQKTYICQRVSLSLTIFLTTSLAAEWAPTGDRE